MRHFNVTLAAIGAVAVSAFLSESAAAQPANNLTGAYRCVQGCAAGYEDRPAYVTQNGWNINIVSETGLPLQAWFDWFSPMTRIWIESLHQGAVYSPDGNTIQFDRGTILRRVIEPTPEVVADCARRFRSYDPNSQTYLGFEGIRHPCPGS